ncbi:Energy-coupling factor transporter ATP-binding protein EcfA2 [Halalkaliarchaeum sp. AArc-CO]|uniref:energy-coupling factor ABC transporter ATP-binding protein n=1 Tax=unclassified Halalkaliarchaeum TaxID=2678344 RepID=UPI00217E1E12|nr:MULTISPECIES: ABC transporter ATP-binding protein [unclassified Halalkaliarchaeum]MDR5671956.1 ABC transporter ATP-binding protein [Halalkaliarchaeum sp. AArc-GB]UWG51462.1 Energy-coupling factor transporter ATP-binding protein EcfA2 [Halalkaliarchaeum sp. AArc-CO]
MIQVRNVTVQYGDVVAVDDVTLQIPDGEFLALVGANGSGKTSLVRTFNGLVTPDEGEVCVDGQEVSSNPVAARTAVGMVFQDPRDCFVAATVGDDVAFGPENLGLSRKEIRKRVESALAAVRMEGREAERIDSLSGGERARVAIAGALAMEPSHLVLDEPFAGLDAPTREAVRNRLRTLHGDGTGIVVVTHDVGTVIERADRVLALADGEIALEADVSGDAAPDPAVEDRLVALGVPIHGRE